MPGSGAEAECLKPGWPRRSPRVPPRAPRHGKADLLSYHCSSAAPASPARPPPGTAARAADTMRAGGQTRTRDPAGVPGTGGCSHPPARGLRILRITPHSLVQRHLAGQRAGTRRRGMRGHSILPLLGNQPWHALLCPQGCSDGEALVQRCPCTMEWLVLIPLAKVLEQAEPPFCSAAPHASLPHVPHTLGSWHSLFLPFNCGERPQLR